MSELAVECEAMTNIRTLPKPDTAPASPGIGVLGGARLAIDNGVFSLLDAMSRRQDLGPGLCALSSLSTRCGFRQFRELTA